MASHLFIKAHRHLPAEDSIVRRIGDVVYVVAVVVSNTLSDWLEDDAARVAAWVKRKRRRS